MNTEVISNTLLYLTKTFTEKDNELRKQAEAELCKLQEEVYDHISSILYILQNQELDSKIRLSIVLYLKNLLKGKITEKKLQQSELINLLKLYTELYLSEKISDNLMQNLNLSLNDVLNSGEVSSVLPDLIEYLKNNSNHIGKCKPILYILQLIISSTATDNKNISKYLVKLIEVIDNIIINVNQNLFSEKFLELIDVVRAVLDFLFLSLLKLKRLSKIDEIIGIYISKYIPFTIDMLLLTTKDWPNYIIFWTEQREYDSAINTMKSKALQVLSYVVQNDNSVQIKNPVLIENIMRIMNVIFNNLNYVITEKSAYLNEMNRSNDNYRDNGYDNILFQILLFFTRVLTREPFMGEYKSHINQFVFDLIFPLISFNKQDLVAITSDGENYYDYILDLIQTHKHKTYKTAAAFLLTKIVSKFDGLSKIIHSYCLKNIESCLINSYNGTKLTPEKEMEVCLIILSILENDIKKVDNGELLLLVENYIDLLLSIDLIVIKSRLCVFFESYLDYFNRKKGDICINYETNVKIIHSLFGMLMLYKDAPGVAYQSAHCLTSLIRYKIYGNIVDDVCKKILPELIKSIGEIQILIFFDVLNNIILYLDIEDKVMIICKEIVQRILYEIKSPQTEISDNYYNTYTNKCFNILLTIVEKYKFFFGENLNEVPSLAAFEQIINPVMLYLKNPAKIYFDDDLIILLTRLIQNVQVVSPYMGEVFAILPKYIKKHGGINKILYDLLISYIQYSNDFFNENTLIILTQMINFGLFEYDELDESGPYSAILSRLILEKVQGISEKFITQLITWNAKKSESIYGLYKDDLNQLNDSMEVNCFISNIVVLYTGFINYPIITANVVSDSLDNFLEWSRVATELPGFPTILAKNIILGICNLLNSNSLQQKYLESFLFITFKLLSNIQLIERDKLKRKLKEELHCNFMPSDEEEDSDNEGYLDSKAMARRIKEELDYSETEDDNDMTDVFKNIPDAFESADEYQIFSQTLNKLINQSSSLNEWIAKLPQSQKEIYVDLLHTRRIKVKDLDINVPRRIVKIKKIK